ncbi:MAG: hypothetical protein WBM08_05625 [Prochlorococcaceae cyanobacterium]
MTDPTPSGLHGKYIIHKRDGSPIEWPAFVLRFDGSDPAAIAAIRAYALDSSCPPELAADLTLHLAQLATPPMTHPTSCLGRIEPPKPMTDPTPEWPIRPDFTRAREIKEELAVVVYGPDGPDTDDCANAWEVAKALARIETHLGVNVTNPPEA